MSLTIAVLMGLLIIPATLAALPDTSQTSPPAWTQANTADKKALDEQLIEAIRADHVEEVFEMNEDLGLQRKLSPGEHSCYPILANYRK